MTGAGPNEAHEAHAAARCDLTGSARAFLNETALPAVRALNGAGGPTLLPAMHRIVNAVQPGLISPEAALYGHWMEWCESNRRHCVRHQAPDGRLLRFAAGPGVPRPIPPSAWHGAAGSAKGGGGWGLGREHVRQVHNGCGVLQVHVDPQKGSARGARSFL